jgi:hypothetical protein
MRSRRTFLAEMSLCLAGLLLPRAVQACGFRRRLCRRVCQHRCLRVDNCTSACPCELIIQVGDNYWYDALCCPDGNNHISICTTNPCSDSNCKCGSGCACTLLAVNSQTFYGPFRDRCVPCQYSDLNPVYSCQDVADNGINIVSDPNAIWYDQNKTKITAGPFTVVDNNFPRWFILLELEYTRPSDNKTIPLRLGVQRRPAGNSPGGTMTSHPEGHHYVMTADPSGTGSSKDYHVWSRLR